MATRGDWKLGANGCQGASWDKFNDREGRGCSIFVLVLKGNGTKIASTGDRFDQPPGQMR